MSAIVWDIRWMTYMKYTFSYVLLNIYIYNIHTTYIHICINLLTKHFYEVKRKQI